MLPLSSFGLCHYCCLLPSAYTLHKLNNHVPGAQVFSLSWKGKQIKSEILNLKKHCHCLSLKATLKLDYFAPSHPYFLLGVPFHYEIHCVSLRDPFYIFGSGNDDLFERKAQSTWVVIKQSKRKSHGTGRLTLCINRRVCLWAKRLYHHQNIEKCRNSLMRFGS